MGSHLVTPSLRRTDDSDAYVPVDPRARVLDAPDTGGVEALLPVGHRPSAIDRRPHVIAPPLPSRTRPPVAS